MGNLDLKCTPEYTEKAIDFIYLSNTFMGVSREILRALKVKEF